MIKAELADGTVLEFPADTPDEVVDAKVKEMIGQVTPTIGPLEGDDPILPTPEEPKEASFADRAAAEAPQTVGGIAAGIGGAIGGAGFLPIVGLVGLGGAAGEAYKQIGQQLSGSLDAPKTAIEAAKRIGKAGLEESGFELAGGLLMKGAGKLLAPYKGAMIEGAEEVMAAFKDKIKPVLLPAEATESRVLDLVQNVSEASLIGGNKLAMYKAERNEFFNDLADGMIKEFGDRTATGDLGNLFVAAVDNAKSVHSKAARIMYNSVKAGRTKIPMKAAKGFAKPLTAKARKLGGIEAKNAGDDLMEAVMELPDNLSFNQAIELRSRLISRIDEYSVVNKKAPAIGKAKKLVGIVDRSIEKALKGIPPKDVGKKPTGKSPYSHLVKTGRGQYDPGRSYDIMSKGEKKAGRVRLVSLSKNGMQVLSEKAYSVSLEDLFITPAMRKKGVASDAVNSIIEDCRDKGVKKITLQVEEGKNKSWLTDMYKELGFKSIGKKGKTGPTQFVMSLSRKPAIGGEALPTPLEAWRTANAFYKEGEAKFNNTLIRRLVKLASDSGTGVETIAPAIFKPGRVSTVAKVKRAVDPDTWRKMQGFFMEHLMQKSTDVNGDIIGKRLINNISGKPGSFGEPMLKEILTAPQIVALKNMGKALELSQKRQAEGAGKVLIQLSQAGAMGAILTGNLKLPAATIIFGPALVSRMMLNPRVGKLLTTGMTLPARSPEAAGIIARLAAAAHRISGED